MSCNRFFKFRNYFHCVDNTVDMCETDKMWKLRSLYDRLKNQCQSLKIEKYVSVDEQIVPFKGQPCVKVYVKGKPQPWGIKIFLLCGRSGLIYDFIISQGATTEIDEKKRIWSRRRYYSTFN